MARRPHVLVGDVGVTGATTHPQPAPAWSDWCDIGQHGEPDDDRVAEVVPPGVWLRRGQRADSTAAHSERRQNGRTLESEYDMPELNLFVDGMSCRRCVREVTARLRDVPGVETVSANPGDRRVTVSGSMRLADVLAAFTGTTYRPQLEGTRGDDRGGTAPGESVQ